MLRAQQEEADSPRVLEWEVNYKIAVSDFTQPRNRRPRLGSKNILLDYTTFVP